MLLSMTGYGESQLQHNGVLLRVEIRSVNNRYLKLMVRTPDGYSGVEARMEALLRGHIKRGTVNVAVRVDRQPGPDDFTINEQVLLSYRNQLIAIDQRASVGGAPLSQDGILLLPGVVEDRSSVAHDADAEWPQIETALNEAISLHHQMRLDEGAAMADDLHHNLTVIGREVESIAALAPRVAQGYRSRIQDRLSAMLAEYDVTVQAADVVREVGLFAERCDISEEIVRLRSHLDQFQQYMQSDESSGRKLEFLTQEMFRETNTIGSKANDAEIARHVVEIKAAIEKAREMIQNVE